MIAKVRSLAREYEDLQQKMQDSSVLADPKQIRVIGKRLSELRPIVDLLAEYDACERIVAEVSKVQHDSELLVMAEEEATLAKANMTPIMEKMQKLLVPKDPNDDRRVMIEVRAGTGGEEAALFASELLRMYLRFAEEQRWPTEIISRTDAEAGGIKEAVMRIDAPVFGMFKFESGVHRVQRIPVTENKGRVHTSAASVAVLPEAEEVDIEIRPQDLKIDTFRSGGAGGQNVNKVESAIRITHLPTGTVVACQTERSQLRNRELAMNLLRSRLYQAEQERIAKERGHLRSGQIGSGDRSEKIRTYNFPQDRLTDHRINRNFSNLPGIMDGHLFLVIEALREQETAERLAASKR
ncbi:MAG: peptide chain release factor 1 [Candidatus Peregrinibacteria bacterium]